jgi:hypothetical protein
MQEFFLKNRYFIFYCDTFLVFFLFKENIFTILFFFIQGFSIFFLYIKSCNRFLISVDIIEKN